MASVARARVPGATAALCALLATASIPAAARDDADPAADHAARARAARVLDSKGEYRESLVALRELRRLAPPDADLEITVALGEARIGRLDSAATLLWGPLLSAALADSVVVGRRKPYPWEREGMWINGVFDGWHWYVARARAEVAASLGRWAEALEAARTAVEARPLSGKEWLIQAVCAGRAGDEDQAAAAAREAARLDPALPEAHYLHGLHEWKAGRRASAQMSFRAAMALDSSYHAPALALVRSRLPAAAPDSLPTRFLTGAREAGLLTSPTRPKMDDFPQVDTPAELVHQPFPQIPDSLRRGFAGGVLSPAILVDERGRVVLNELPWIDPSRFPSGMVSLILGAMSDWVFKPPQRLGAPHRAWMVISMSLRP